MPNDLTALQTAPSTQLLTDIKKHLNQLTSKLQSMQLIDNQNIDYFLLELGKNISLLSREINAIEEERHDLRELAEIAWVINSSVEINEVLRIVMDKIIELTGAERCFLMLKEPNGSLSLQIARNWEQESIEQSDLAISKTIVNDVVKSGEPIVTTNAINDPRFGKQESIVTHNLRSILCVPLKVKDEITGVIYADNRLRAGVFTKSGRDILAAFANQAAIAIDNARLFNSLRSTLAEVTKMKSLMGNVFESIASGVITIDNASQVTFCNRAAATILKIDSQSIQSKSIQQWLSPISAKLEQMIEWVQQKNRSLIGIEVTPRIPKRGKISISVSITPLKDPKGTPQGTVIVIDDLTERRRLEAQYRLFERMVSPALIDQLDPDQIQLGGERKLITAIFADIRGYTKFSEGMTPENLVSILNLYLSAAADAIIKQGGTIDKFQGDAVFAWFNAPVLQTKHTLRAIKAALDIQQSIIRLHKSLPQEYRLAFGIGIHYGEAVLGLIGTEKRLDYTAIGDSINITKRIQENAINNQILISAEAYEQVKGLVSVKSVEPLRVKGKSQPLHVFEVLMENAASPRTGTQP